ncbi:FAD-dependent thiol oxidase [Cylindrobasidium torrendii FP15055 ss-10]|uniref:Sulfhydryl oxidase n=1 Tax=Cylindrobasidium torrendii FP15055 ss-10 TaxID=1314674 RepID=A0A0D7B652_9AGAR|nr:FAD-dependent thiol oxidase [Cylindrobasidium torrendii FP15055 ss-10]
MSDASKPNAGVVLGPDGKPCKPCTAFRNWNPTGAKKGVAKKAPTAAPPEDCPPDVEQMGRATWTFLHTTAAYYPEKPSPTHRANMLLLLKAIPLLYACTHCADDFGKDIAVNPPDVSSRTGLSRWLCERHNEVNTKLGKARFDCSLNSTDERWKDGPADGRCD